MTTVEEVYPDAPALAAAIADRLTGRIALIQAEGRRPSVVLTGGTIAIDAYELIESELVDWTQVDFYWGDERFVPEGHADRNDQQARDAFLDRLGVPAANIHSMPAHGCDVSTAEAADQYAAALPAGAVRRHAARRRARTATSRRCSPGSPSCTRRSGWRSRCSTPPSRRPYASR